MGQGRKTSTITDPCPSMDGNQEGVSAASGDATLRHVTFRVQHDCPLARLSEALPEVVFRAWNGHTVEVIEVTHGKGGWDMIAEAARDHLPGVQVLPTDAAGLLIWRPTVSSRESISRRLERHGLMWLQPLRVQAGWEHYDAFAFEPGGEQAALDALQADHPTQVASRQDVQAEELATALFQSMLPALDAPTPKQAEALVAAWQAGYYRSPRDATTKQVAERVGIGRSALEERLRAGENRVMGRIVPALARHLHAP